MYDKVYRLSFSIVWKFLFILIGIVIFLGMLGQSVLAEQGNIVNEEEIKSYEVEFVIDVSVSMLQSEAGVTALELLTETIELLEDTNTKVGIVGYNHTIAYRYSLTSLIKKKRSESDSLYKFYKISRRYRHRFRVRNSSKGIS